MKEIDRIRLEYARRSAEIPEDFYSLDKPGNRFIHEQRLKNTAVLLESSGFSPLAGKKILEIGCGKGEWLQDLKTLGVEEAHLQGIDLLSERIEEARKKLPASNFCIGDASRLPWPDDFFDLVLQSTVFTSILDPGLRAAVASEMVRVLKPAGLILWYDFHCDNPWNPNVRGIGKKKDCRTFSSLQHQD